MHGCQCLYCFSHRHQLDSRWKASHVRVPYSADFLPLITIPFSFSCDRNRNVHDIEIHPAWFFKLTFSPYIDLPPPKKSLKLNFLMICTCFDCFVCMHLLVEVIWWWASAWCSCSGQTHNEDALEHNMNKQLVYLCIFICVFYFCNCICVFIFV